jgi:hypothetical protein
MISPWSTASAARRQLGDTGGEVRIDETVLTARLRDVPASRDLVPQLPLTLTFRDFNGVEKISRLPRELSMDGVLAGDDPAPRDTGYYAPSGDLVFYYGDVGYWTGIVRLGQFDGSVDAIRSRPASSPPRSNSLRRDCQLGPDRPAPPRSTGERCGGRSPWHASSSPDPRTVWGGQPR